MIIVFWRTIFLYFFVIVVLRFMGKRQIGELQPSELVTTIIISNIAAIPIENMGTPLIHGVIAIGTLACFEIFFSLAEIKSKKARSIIIGNPQDVIQHGKINQKSLRLLRWSIDDLLAQLRNKGIFNINDVELAIVETNGSLSVLQKFQYRPVNNQNSKRSCQDADLPAAVIISDGVIVNNALTFANVTERWLQEILVQERLALSDIFLMSCDTSKKYVIVKKEV